MKLKVLWDSVTKAGGKLVDRVLGRTASAEASAVKVAAKPAVHTPAPAAVVAKPVTSFDHALSVSRGLKSQTLHGVSNPQQFAADAASVLNSPQAGNFASEVTRHVAKAMVDQPQSGELAKALIAGHRKLDANIAQRMTRVRHMDDPADLAALHTNNIRDARTIIATGAPPALRDDAFRDLARSVDGLMSSDPAAARRISGELARESAEFRDRFMMAARQLKREQAVAAPHDAGPAVGTLMDHAPASPSHLARTPAAPVQPTGFPAAPQAPGLTDMDRVWADQRLRALGVIPSRPAAAAPAAPPRVEHAIDVPELSLADNLAPPRPFNFDRPATPTPAAPLDARGVTTAWDRLATPRQRSAAEEYAARQSGAGPVTAEFVETDALRAAAARVEAPAASTLRNTPVDGIQVGTASPAEWHAAVRAQEEAAARAAAARQAELNRPIAPYERDGIRVESASHDAWDEAVRAQRRPTPGSSGP